MSNVPGYIYATDYPGDIQGAQTACEQAGGSILYFPPGVYDFTTTVYIGNTNPGVGATWLGAGAGASILQGNVSGTVQPSFVSTAQASTPVSFVTIADLSFIGNGFQNPPILPGEMIVLSGGSHHKVQGCYFSTPPNEANTTGIVIALNGVLNAEVSGCRFYKIGLVNNTQHPNSHTDAVSVSATSIGVRVHNNHIESCGLGGIHILGNVCDASHNFATQVYGGDIHLGGLDMIAAFNDGSETQTVAIGQTAGSQAIDVGSGASTLALIGNMLHDNTGDGFASNGYSNLAFIGNSAYNNNNQGENDCGIQYIGQKGAGQNLGLTFLGNNSFDLGSGITVTQLAGFHVYTTDSAFATCLSLIGNVAYNNLNQQIFQSVYGSGDFVTIDDTSSFYGNSCLPERSHLLQTSPTHSTSPYSLQSATVPGQTMLSNAGIKVQAAGTTSGNNGYKHFELMYGGQQVFTFQTGSFQSGPWEFKCVITNYDSELQIQKTGDSTSEQAYGAFFISNGTLQTFSGTLTVDSKADQPLVLSAWLDSSADGITSDYLFVERF